MFDHNAMQELKHLAADRYQRAGGGGAHKVHATNAAFHKSRGYAELSPFRQAAYRARVEFNWIADHIRAELAYAPTAFKLAQEEKREATANALRSIPF
jgi:hypothetical protein